jgi:hypothetical protein
MTAISLLQSHILENKAHIKILERKTVSGASTAGFIADNIQLRQQEIKELEDAIAILSRN